MINGDSGYLIDCKFPTSGEQSIISVKTSSKNATRVAVMVANSRGKHFASLWNISQKEEEAIFEISSQAQIVTDKNGEFVIID